MTHDLYTPFDLKGLSLKNRLVMAPMTRCRAAAGDVPTALMGTYYAQRATAGLIISEGAPVSDTGHGYLWTPGMHTTAQAEGWRLVADAVHGADGRMFVQLWHVGRVSHTSLQPGGEAPLSASAQHAVDAQCFAYDGEGNPGYVQVSAPRAMTVDDMASTRGDFVRAARMAMQVGMDGVELHAANGYLLDQYLNSRVNTRDDAYGGTVQNRCRFILEVLDAVAAEIGSHRVGLRISPGGQFNAMPEDPEMEATFLHLAGELAERDIAFLHVNDQATFGLPAIPEGFLAKLRAAYPGNIILCGGYDAARATRAIDDGLADLVAFGMSYLANPDLPARLANGWPLNEPDSDTFYGGDAAGYTDYPFYRP